MAGGRRLPPSMERLWLGELRRAHAIINIITIMLGGKAFRKSAFLKEMYTLPMIYYY
jgi:hypothetical protein